MSSSRTATISSASFASGDRIEVREYADAHREIRWTRPDGTRILIAPDDAIAAEAMDHDLFDELIVADGSGPLTLQFDPAGRRWPRRKVIIRTTFGGARERTVVRGRRRAHARAWLNGTDLGDPTGKPSISDVTITIDPPRLRMRTTAGESAREVFAWFERPGAFERLCPPWERIRTIERSGTIHDGDTTVLRISKGPVHVRWIARHREFEPDRRFVDVQVKGPLKRWVHTHLFAEPGVMEDRVDYRLPLEPASMAIAGRWVARTLDRQFTYRHRIVPADLRRHRSTETGKRFVIAGGTGLIGSALIPFLTTGGHTVTTLTRHPTEPGEAAWDPATSTLDPRVLEGADVVINLAGESIGGHRWNPETKQRIIESRASSTRLLVSAIERLDRPPATFICASAMGFYGDRGDDLITESDRAGEGFLTDVCLAWEAAAKTNAARVVNPRFGIVCTPAGGALKPLLLPALAGLAGPIGRGRQWWSWVTIDDVVYALHHLALRSDVQGPVNVAAPGSVTNRDFIRTLARILHRPGLVPLPKPAVRLLLGEMAGPLLLYSARMTPAALERDGFRFEHPELEPGLRHVLGR